MPAPSGQQSGPLWGGPEDRGPNGGVTQSLISKWLTCRERFRLAQVEGWRSKGDFEKVILYGNFWHLCEEMVAGSQGWQAPLREYAEAEAKKNPVHAEEIEHWYRACKVVFPEYLRFWSTHKDTVSRKSLGEEYIFDLDYHLPRSGRVVRLRGKYDGVELLQKPSGPEVWLFETKTKGSIEQGSIEKLLTYDLQVLFYLNALSLMLYGQKK